MKIFFSITALVFALSAIHANADWTCTYSCGSKGQEQKLGHGDTQSEACQEAQSQICTEYNGGYPQYYQGSSWVDSGEDGSGGYGSGEWQCTYSCGSKGQEQKVGYGWSEDEATREAQDQICTQYVGGHPQYFQGCQRVGN